MGVASLFIQQDKGKGVLSDREVMDSILYLIKDFNSKGVERDVKSVIKQTKARWLGSR